MKISTTLATAVITVASLAAIIVLASLGKPVPVELYMLTSMGFAGHFALAQPSAGESSTSIAGAALQALQGALGGLSATGGHQNGATAATGTSPAPLATQQASVTEPVPTVQQQA